MGAATQIFGDQCNESDHHRLKAKKLSHSAVHRRLASTGPVPSEGKGHTFESCRVRHKIKVRSGHMGYGLYRRHR
jgi:hypothetical protein